MPPAKKKKTAKHKDIIAFIKAVRESFPDAPIIYRYGGCYGFHLILKEVYPTADPFVTANNDHIVTRINDRFYDVLGEYVNNDGELFDKVKKLTEKQKEYWETVASGQRVEFMLKKYNGEL